MVRSRKVEKAMGLLGSKIHLPPVARDEGDLSPTAQPQSRKSAGVDESWIVI